MSPPSQSSSSSCYWVSDTFLTKPPPACLCLGTGRFLRSVLVPLLSYETEQPPILVQTRGSSFVEYMQQQKNQTQNPHATYPVDTVLSSGVVQTDHVRCSAVFSLGRDRASLDTILFPLLRQRHQRSSSVHDTDDTKLYSKNENESVTETTTTAGADEPLIRVIGVGVTEHGLASPDTTAMRDLYDILDQCRLYQHQQVDRTLTTHSPKICIINTDNVPYNGDVLKRHMLHLAATKTTTTAQSGTQDTMVHFLEGSVAFLNTMVDRITSHRPDNDQEPRAEPLPAKALVILDTNNDLPVAFRQQQTIAASTQATDITGLVIRTTPEALDRDLALKLRIANGTHTALAHAMALLSLAQTDVLSPTNNLVSSLLLMDWIHALVHDQIIPAAVARFGDASSIDHVWTDWQQRLTHAHFGLSTFFITQNGAAKGGIRLGPTVVDLLQLSPESKVSVSMALAFAILLRWLTPAACTTPIPSNGPHTTNDNQVYIGWLNGSSRTAAAAAAATGVTSSSVVTYADGLRYDLDAGWYEFKCACQVTMDRSNPGLNELTPLTQGSVSAWLGSLVTPQQPSVYQPIIRAYMTAPTGGNLASVAGLRSFDTFVSAVTTLYARLVAGDDLLTLLQEIKDKGLLCADLVMFEDVHHDTVQAHGSPLHYRASPIPNNSALLDVSVFINSVASVVFHEVAAAQIVDIHTHLLPPSHGVLCLWGIDELLTYHYLVAEYFMTAPASMSPEILYAKTKQEQADLIWQALFVERTPLSEATRGVVTTIIAFGLKEELATRDLGSIRKFYSAYRDQGLYGAEQFSDLVHSKSGVRYNIMTNIPFDTNEAQHWRPKRKEFPEQYRSALRVDPLLSGDRRAVEVALKGSGFDVTIESARQYLRDWCDVMKPEYMMAATPHDFVLNSEASGSSKSNTGVNVEAMKEVGAFATLSGAVTCDAAMEDFPSVINEHSDLLTDVLMKICEERDLPLALKIGVNPRLKQAGDGVVAFADASMLGRLCSQFPRVRFLATFLSRTNQHEACVLASKFNNLHIYGCWWYCFTPSIVKEITQMRIEMLGTAFTAQHSDARVLDQLIYKWSHSRTVIADVLTQELIKLCASGWVPTRSQIRRDVANLFGGSYEEFMTKSLK